MTAQALFALPQPRTDCFRKRAPASAIEMARTLYELALAYETGAKGNLEEKNRKVMLITDYNIIADKISRR